MDVLLLLLLFVMATLAVAGVALLIILPLVLVRRHGGTAAAERPEATEPPPSPTRAVDAGDLEVMIGSRWLLYLGVAAVIVGLAYFVRYAFTHAWLTEPVRVLLAAAAGLALMILGRRLAAGGVRLFGQVLAGGGLVVLYVAAYAAYGYYGLIGNAAAFALLLAVSALAYTLARRDGSLPFAALAVLGGFATPFLAGGYRESPVAFLTFDLALVAGTLMVARGNGWPGLIAIAYGAAVASLAAWAGAAYVSSLWLTTELFLTAFAVLFTWGAVMVRRSASPFATGLAAVLFTAPVLYYAASLGLLGSRTPALLAFLGLLVLLGVGLAWRTGKPALTLVFWLAAALPFWVKAPVLAESAWLGLALACGAAIALIPLFAAWRTAAAPPPARIGAAVALIHLEGWWLFGVMYELLGVHGPGWRAHATLGLAAASGLAWVALRARAPRAALHHLGLALGLAAAAIVLWLEGYPATAAIAIQGTTMIWLGLAGGQRWIRGVGELLVAAAGLRLLAHLMGNGGLATTPFANALAVTALAVVALLYLSAGMYHRWPGRGTRPAQTIVLLTASVLALLTLTAETSRVFTVLGHTGDWLTSPHPARQGAISALWAAYALVLVAVGLVRRYPPIRYLALALFAVTILKLLVVDLAAVSQAAKMATVLVVGLLLLVASYLYTKKKATGTVGTGPDRLGDSGGG